MDPVSSNTMNKGCVENISSNCIPWAGPSIPGINICKGASITEVIYQLAIQNTISAPCYTGNWINFASTIPLTGSGPGYSFTISNFGAGGTNSPQYKWTKEGDLSFRGGFDLAINVTLAKNYILIPLVTIPTTCMPTGFTASQYVTTGVDMFTGQQQISIVNASDLFLEYPSGILSLLYQYANPTLTPMTLNVDFGGCRLNLA